MPRLTPNYSMFRRHVFTLRYKRQSFPPSQKAKLKEIKFVLVSLHKLDSDRFFRYRWEFLNHFQWFVVILQTKSLNYLQGMKNTTVLDPLALEALWPCTSFSNNCCEPNSLNSGRNCSTSNTKDQFIAFTAIFFTPVRQMWPISQKSLRSMTDWPSEWIRFLRTNC